MATPGGPGPINLHIDMQMPDAPERLNIPAVESKDQGVTEETGGRMVDYLKLILAYTKNDPNAEEIEAQLLNLGVQNKKAAQFAKDGTERTPQGVENKKVRQYFLKRMVMADLLTKMTGYLKKIASGGLDLLKALMMLAILGPEFLNGIIDLVVSTAIMVIEAFIRAIPTVINAIIMWLPRIIQIIADLIPVLLNTLISAFGNLANNKLIPKPLRMFFAALEGILKLIKLLTENLWLLIPILLIIAVGYIAMLVLETAIKLKATAATLLMIGAIALIVIAVIALIAIFILLYLYADEVSAYMESLWEDFKKLSIWGKLLVGALALLFFPLTMLIGFVYGFVKAAQWFKSGAAAKAWEKFMGGIKSGVAWLLDIPSRISQMGSEIRTALSKAFSMENLKSQIKEQFDNVFGAGSMDRAMELMMQAKQWIDDMLSAILDNKVVKLAVDFWNETMNKKSPEEKLRDNLQALGGSQKGVERRRNDLINLIQSNKNDAQRLVDIDKVRREVVAEGSDPATLALLDRLADMVKATDNQTFLLEEMVKKTQEVRQHINPSRPDPAGTRR